MRQGAPIDQAQEAITPKAPQIPPQAPIGDTGLVTLLAEGPLACEHRANGLITSESVRVPDGVVDEEGQLQRRDRVAGHRFLLHQQRPIQGLSEESLYTRCAKPLED